MAEPNMGDMGLVESQTQRDLNDEAIDEQTVLNIRRDMNMLVVLIFILERYMFW